MTAPAVSPRTPASDPEQIRLLVAEDEQHLGAILEHFLRGRGYATTMCRDGRSALEALQTAPYDVALLDIVMPEMDGLEVLRHLQSEPAPPEVIIITGNGTIDTAITAIKLGAYDYISKPYRMAEIDVMVRRAWEKRELGKANTMLRRRAAVLPESLAHSSAAMAAAVEKVDELAPGLDPIVLVGEPGVGKSHVARYVHQVSRRAPDALFELGRTETGGHPNDAGTSATPDALFGCQRNRARTGAGSVPSAGAFLLADRGTVVVDIDALPDETRRGLGDALRQRCFTRVGGAELLPLTARVIVCTRTVEMCDGIPGPRVTLPALRDRRDDLEQLTAELLHDGVGPSHGLSADALQSFGAYGWPGNVRELKAVLTRASAIAGADVVNASHIQSLLALEGSLANGGPSVSPAAGALSDLEKMHIQAMLVRCNWHQGRAAAALGISTKTLYRKIREYGFHRPRKRKLSRVRPEA